MMNNHLLADSELSYFLVIARFHINFIGTLCAKILGSSDRPFSLKVMDNWYNPLDTSRQLN